MLHAFVNGHLLYNFKFTTIMDSTLSDIFRTNHEQNTVEFETIRLSVVRYAMTQPEGNKDQRRTAIFHTYIKWRDKCCKIIINNWSCINAISSNTVACLGLKLVPYPMPYNVSLVNNNSITVNERCLFPIKFLDYNDEIWCDVIPMNVGHVILDRSWIYDLDITIFG